MFMKIIYSRDIINIECVHGTFDVWSTEILFYSLFCYRFVDIA